MSAASTHAGGTSGAGADVDPDAAYERARVLLTMRRLEAAERELRGTLVRDPQHANSHALLAIALHGRGAADEALAEANEAVRLAPESWFPHYAAAHVLKNGNRSAEALRAVRAALDIAPTRPSLWELLARVHLRRREWREAVEAARQGLHHDPADGDLASHLALALSARADTPQADTDDGPRALASATEALRLGPEESLAHIAYGYAALATKDPWTAAQAFREALRLDPSIGLARTQLLVALKCQNPMYRAMSGALDRLRGRIGEPGLFQLPSLAVYPLVAWAGWAADALLTLRLRYDPYARSLLDRAETRLAQLCVLALAAGVPVLVIGMVGGLAGVVGTGLGMMTLLTAIRVATMLPDPTARLAVGGWAAALAMVLGLSLIGSVASAAATSAGQPGVLGWLAVPASLLTAWLPARASGTGG